MVRTISRNKQKLENLSSEILKIQERKKQLSQDLDNHRNKSSGFIKKKEDSEKEILTKEKLVYELETKIKNFKEATCSAKACTSRTSSRNPPPKKNF